MAAGQGFKTFTTGEVLTAADVNGYLMQGVNVFASATERDAEITSPQEGQTSYLKDTDVIQVYSGSAWVTKSGAPSPLTTKGDLYTYSTTDARLAVGTNGQFLSADSTASTGLAWVAGGGSTSFTLLNAGGTALTGATTVTVSGISNQQTLWVYISGASSVNSSAYIGLRINTDTASNYYYVGFRNGFSSSGFTPIDSNNDNILLFQNASAPTVGSGSILIEGTKGSGVKVFDVKGAAETFGFNTKGYWSGSASVTSISVVSSSGNLDAGTVYVYGSSN